MCFYLVFVSTFNHRFVGRVTDEPRTKTGIISSESHEMVALIERAGHEKSTQ